MVSAAKRRTIGDWLVKRRSFWNRLETGSSSNGKTSSAVLDVTARIKRLGSLCRWSAEWGNLRISGLNGYFLRLWKWECWPLTARIMNLPASFLESLVMLDRPWLKRGWRRPYHSQLVIMLITSIWTAVSSALWYLQAVWEAAGRRRVVSKYWMMVYCAGQPCTRHSWIIRMHCLVPAVLCPHGLHCYRISRTMISWTVLSKLDVKPSVIEQLISF